MCSAAKARRVNTQTLYTTFDCHSDMQNYSVNISYPPCLYYESSARHGCAHDDCVHGDYDHGAHDHENGHGGMRGSQQDWLLNRPLILPETRPQNFYYKVSILGQPTGPHQTALTYANVLFSSIMKQCYNLGLANRKTPNKTLNIVQIN